MKRKLLLVFTLLTTLATAQVNQYEALKEIPDGTLMKGYHSIEKGEDGKYTGSSLSAKQRLEHHNSIYGKLYTLKVVDETKEREAYDFRGPATNHYTEPSIIGGSEGYGFGYVILNNVIYYLKDIENWQNPTSFKIDEIYILPEKKEASEGEEKKKLTMKERIAAAKAAMAASYPEELTEIDHKKVLKEYFTAMAKKQSTASLTAEEKTELAAIEKAEEDRVAKINERNSEFWNGEEGQAIRDRDAHFAKVEAEGAVLVNDLGTTLWICYGSGVSDDLEPGEKKIFRCDGDIVGTVYKGTHTEGVSGADYNMATDAMFEVADYCGKTVNASTVMP